MHKTVAGRRMGWLALACVTAGLGQPAHAQLFGDNEARRAILDLRQRYQAVSEENARMRTSMLELQNQLEALRGEIAKTRGREEQLGRDVADLQRRQKDLASALVPPSRTAAPRPAAGGETEEEAGAAPDGKEKAAFEGALKQFRSGDYAKAQLGFRNFLKAYPQSSQRMLAVFWLGNSDYALRNYRSAMANFRTLITQAPDHERAPEAWLSIANCQLELKETAAARTTLEQLIAKYPRSEAAQAGKDRLSRLK